MGWVRFMAIARQAEQPDNTWRVERCRAVATDKFEIHGLELATNLDSSIGFGCHED